MGTRWLRQEDCQGKGQGEERCQGWRWRWPVLDAALEVIALPVVDDARVVGSREELRARDLDDLVAVEALDRPRHLLRLRGNLQPIVWNRRTGNIVGGHQRVTVFDSIHGTKDYTLKVAAVDLSEAEEREANILLNNPEAQGAWDLEKLAGLFRDKEIKIELDNTGFDAGALYRLFGDSPLEESHQLDSLAAKVREARERQQSFMAGAAEKYSLEYFCVVVFRDHLSRVAFLTALGLEDERYHDARPFLRALSPERAEVFAKELDGAPVSLSAVRDELALQSDPEPAAEPKRRRRQA